MIQCVRALSIRISEYCWYSSCSSIIRYCHDESHALLARCSSLKWSFCILRARILSFTQVAFTLVLRWFFSCSQKYSYITRRNKKKTMIPTEPYSLHLVIVLSTNFYYRVPLLISTIKINPVKLKFSFCRLIECFVVHLDNAWINKPLALIASLSCQPAFVFYS